MQVDTQTTIFDQVPPISASINIKQEPSGEAETEHTKSNGAQADESQDQKSKNTKHLQAVQEFTSNDKDYVILAKQIEKNLPNKSNLAKKTTQTQKVLTSNDHQGKQQNML